jgi:hypothetical protein
MSKLNDKLSSLRAYPSMKVLYKKTIDENNVRVAQDFSMRYQLVNGQGNFGSMDGDGAAAMRYTEAKLKPVAEELLLDIEKNTVEFIPNYDGSHMEPSVLPAKLPNLLLNGSVGIAVGMATNIPPHNLTELVDAIVYISENPDCAVEDLLQFVKGPDLNDQSPMPFGAHVGTPMEKVPASYLLYCWNNGWNKICMEDTKRGSVARYIRDNMAAICKEDSDTIPKKEGED